MDADTARVAATVVEHLVNVAGDTLIDREFDRKTIPFVVETITRDMFNALAMVFIQREDITAEQTGSLWSMSDEEPAPVPIDSWARGAVPVVRKPKHAPVDLLGASDRPRTPGSASVRSVASSTKRRPDSRTDSRSVGAAAAASGPRPHGADASPTPSGRSVGRSSAASCAAGKSRAGTITSGSEKHGRVGFAKSAYDLAVQQEQDQLAAAQQQLKGKDFGYDHTGKIVELANVDPERLPKGSISTKIAIKNPSEADGNNNDGKKKKTSAVGGGVGRTPSTSKAAAGGSGRESAASGMVKLQTVRFVDDVQPQPGVTVREDGSTKVGPSREKDKSHMSKKDFMSAAAMTSSMSMMRKSSSTTAAALSKKPPTLSSEPQNKLTMSATVNTLTPMSPSNKGLNSTISPRSSGNNTLKSTSGAGAPVTGPPMPSALKSSLKSRKDRSTRAPVSAYDEFASMRKYGNLAPAVSSDTSLDSSFGNKTLSFAGDRTLVENPELARQLLQED